MEFSHMAELPNNLAEELKSKHSDVEEPVAA